MTNRVKIEILGSSYIIATSEDEEYVRSLAKEINDTASAIQQSDPYLSLNNILVLCALSSFDSYRKSEQSADNMRAQLTQYLEDSSSARIEISNLHRELDEARNEIERLRRINGGDNT